jgi:microcystin-dependent protein
MPLSLPNDFVNGQVADAVPVQNNYEIIESYINAEVITRDGLTAMQAPLTLVGDPTADNHAANKDYVDHHMAPIASILLWAVQGPPTDLSWHLCDGTALATASYPELFSLIGYNYGGSGGTFMLPNLKGRFPIGMDGTTNFPKPGKSGGTFTVPVPPHSHAHPHTHTMAHTHEHPHTHPINHDHGQFNSSGPTTQHTHGLSMRQTNAVGSTGSSMQAGTSGTTTAQHTGVDETTHVHIINVPPFTGTSGAVSEATTGGSSAASTGASSTTETSDNTVATGPAGGSISTTMIQPYLTVNFIIRVR